MCLQVRSRDGRRVSSPDCEQWRPIRASSFCNLPLRCHPNPYVHHCYCRQYHLHHIRVIDIIPLSSSLHQIKGQFSGIRPAESCFRISPGLDLRWGLLCRSEGILRLWWNYQKVAHAHTHTHTHTQTPRRVMQESEGWVSLAASAPASTIK